MGKSRECGRVVAVMHHPVIDNPKTSFLKNRLFQGRRFYAVGASARPQKAKPAAGREAPGLYLSCKYFGTHTSKISLSHW